MTFERYWNIVAKQWKIIVVCFVLVGLGTYIVSRLLTPQYQSTVIVEVAIHSASNQVDIYSLQASDQLVQTEAQLAISDPVLREVTSRYPGLTVDNLYKEVSVSPKLNTQLFQIDVLDANPQRAAGIANDIATTLIKQQFQVRQQENTQAQQQLQQDIAQTRQQMASINGQISNLQGKGASQAHIAPLQSQLNSLQKHYDQWQQALAQLELAQAQSGDILRVAQSAQPSIVPVRPNIPLNTSAGLAAGLLLGLVAAVLVEQFDKRIRSSEALTQFLEWPVLAAITMSEANNSTVNPSGRDMNVESYRILRTNIGFSGVDKPLRFLMVTSALPGDGKSTIAANIAIFMAKAGKNTLLIDADLRRPTAHEKFGLSPDKMGLSNAILLYGNMPVSAQAVGSPSSQGPGNPSTNISFSLEPFMHTVGIPNLRLMPSGPLPPNPPELLDSKAMQRLFLSLENCGAEVVIFDTPPILGLSDTSILASKVDGVVVVADISRTNRVVLKQMKTMLAQAGAHVLGCVVNKQRRHRGHSPYSYYYYYHSEEQDSDGHHRHQKAPVTANNSSTLKRTLFNDKKDKQSVYRK